MEPTTNNLHMYQKSLDDDSDLKSSFVHAGKESDSDSDSDEDACKIIIPSRPKKRDTDTSQELLFQLIKQNQVLSRTQRKMYEIQSELDKEEISTRYIKLDLNNTQVKFDETKVKFKECKRQLSHARIENWVGRIVVLMYFIFQIYLMIVPVANRVVGYFD